MFDLCSGESDGIIMLTKNTTILEDKTHKYSLSWILFLKSKKQTKISWKLTDHLAISSVLTNS